MGKRLSHFDFIDIRLQRRLAPAPGEKLGQLVYVTKRFRIDLDIDAERLIRELGADAARNRSKRAKLGKGAIVAQAREVKL